MKTQLVLLLSVIFVLTMSILHAQQNQSASPAPTGTSPSATPQAKTSPTPATETEGPLKEFTPVPGSLEKKNESGKPGSQMQRFHPRRVVPMSPTPTPSVKPATSATPSASPAPSSR